MSSKDNGTQRILSATRACLGWGDNRTTPAETPCLVNPKLLFLRQLCLIFLDAQATNLPPARSGSHPSLPGLVFSTAQWHPFLLQ